MLFFLKYVFCILALWIGVNHASMQWTLVQDTNAVCNDYSRAGFFIERTDTTKWIIFLESGGLCYSAETCNERFFRSEVRTEFSNNNDDSSYNYDPDFNLTQTFGTLQSLGRSPSDYINPYMTSMATFNYNVTEIDGKDFLDSSKQLNPSFHDFNRVVIPYCSSDVWLAEDDYVPDGVDLNSANPQKQFLDDVYSPEAKTLQFTFRGQTILRGVIEQLLENHDLSDASEILLAGSSAGGLGVVNNAKWIMSELENNTVNANVSILVDSSWFINFRGNIYRRFDGTENGSESNDSETDRSDTRFFDLIDSVPQCAMDTPTGSPCCVSLECVLLDERYFPVGQIPVMVVFSLYDIFLLADAIAQLIPPGVSINEQPSLGSDFILTIAEYGGAMNSSIIYTTPQLNGLSYIATECFQHVYFATSTLWGTDGVLGTNSTQQLNISLGAFGGSFTHRVESNVWNSYDFGGDSKTTAVSKTKSCDTSKAHTMQDAINMWYRCRYINNTLQFRDTCHTVHCHNSCPDKIDLSDITKTRYPSWSVIVIVCIVVSVTVISIIAKIIFYAWEIILFTRQGLYLERITDKTVTAEEGTDGVPKFPTCDVSEVVSVACLDLKYSINLHKKIIKDENKDSTSILFAIPHIDENEEETIIKQNIPLVTRGSMTLLKKRSSKDLFRNNDLKNLEDEPIKPTLETDKKSSLCCHPFKSESKQILKGISLYFNPGELVGIMGPSGCGKTTFLDLLTGRRRTGKVEGEIFVNGVRLDFVREEYISNTGYVLQLATPYYDELTVRDNITLAAQMKLPKTMNQREKFERVEQVIQVTGLKPVSETVVGGLSGPGLSGGQKKRLTIALQLLTMPKVIFLDEPTSGLDATAAIELLNHLNALANSNRTVVLTIHQPRFEIFYMFHKLVLLSDGKVAYHGLPKNAYAFFVEALMSSFLRKNLILPQIEEQNPADVIMDMLGKPHFRQIILDHYQESSEPNLVKWAIGRASVKDFMSMNLQSRSKTLKARTNFKLTRRPATRKIAVDNDFNMAKPASAFDRLSVLETRAGKRSSIIWRLYLPIIFFVYGVLLGTIYFQQEDPLLIITGFSVYSIASSLFMFPVMQSYLIKALKVYAYENGDGAGLPSDIVLQGFARFATMSFFPVIIGSTAVYFLSISMKFWSASVLLQLIILGLALNQTWIALLTSLICTVPSLAFRLSPIVTSITGFTSGFFIPISQTPWIYRWFFYINPNYYGFGAAANIILSNIECQDDDDFVECLFGSGGFILKRFNFDRVRPFMNIAILLLMTALYLLLAIFSNWVRHTKLFSKLKVKLRSRAMKEEDTAEAFTRITSPSFDDNHKNDIELSSNFFPTISEPEDQVGTGEINKQTIESQQNKIKKKSATLVPKSTNQDSPMRLRFYSCSAKREIREEQQCRQTLRQRLQQFNLHTNATKEVLKEQTEPEEFDIETEDNNFRSITLKLMQLNRLQSDSLDDGDGITSPEITAPKLLAASSALKWRNKAKIHHPKIPEEVTEMESDLNTTGLDLMAEIETQ